MAIDVKLKRSHTHSTIPTTSNLVEGEVAFNTHDRKMYMRDGSNNVVTISDHYATAFDGSAQNFYVTVASSTVAHPYHGTGSSSKYKINGVFSPFLKLIPKNTYTFHQTDSSNSGHPFRFYLDAAKTTAYTTGVTTNGTPGNAGAYTQIVVAENAPSVLYYQCSAHGYMGWAASTSTIGTTDTITEGSTNLYYTDARAQAVSINNVAEDSTPQLGGSLDVVTHKIISTSNGNIDIEPHGTGNVLLGNLTFDADQTVGSGQDNYVMTYDHSAGTIGLESAASGGASNTFKTISVSGQSDVVADSATDTLTLVAGSNITLTTNAGTDAITIASSGGGGGSAITVKDEGSALSTAASSLNFVGSSVTASGTGVDKTITITDPTYQVTNTVRETFTGNGSTTTFTLSNLFTTDGAVVFYNGQHLTPTTDYAISGQTLTFTFTPVNSSEIVVRSIGVGRIKLDKFTANGSATTFTLTNSYVNIDQFMVFVNGSLLVPATDYTFNTGTSVLTFTYTPANNDEINVRGVTENNAVVGNRYTYVATNNQTAFTGADAASQTLSFLADNVEVFLNGSKLNKQQGDFTVSGGTTVTLASGAATSDILEILVFESYSVANALKISSNLSDVNNATTALNNLGGASTGKAIAMSIVFGG
tara:strand:- start:7178 stop:9118 length:1941 start_codon:yes stop_codon:yes gene_type:complete